MMNLKRTFAAGAIAGSFMFTSAASAIDWPSLALFGNYRPYGLRNSMRVPNPPYFSLHPPVYYGNRHTRPYGISPFAAYPMVTAPKSYKARLDSDFRNPPAKPQVNPFCDDCLSEQSAVMPQNVGHQKRRNGLVRKNPFVKESRPANEI